MFASDSNLDMSKFSFVALLCFLLLAIVQAVPDGRIVGGSHARKGQFPYQISLQFSGKHGCGGSIISKNYILTAAHCVTFENTTKILPLSMLKIHAGTTNIKKGGVKIPVDQIILHPDFFWNRTYRTYDDIALMRLKESLTFSETIKPIGLYSGITWEGTPVTVSGWGSLNHRGGTSPTELQWIVLKSASVCRDAEKLICVARSEEKGACDGDSGGPAVTYQGLVGVTSFGYDDCNSVLPDHFVKVARYIDWIKENSDIEKMSEESQF